MAKILWVANDCLGKEVELSDATWKSHIAKRGYMAPFLGQVRETVEGPDVCIRDSTDALHYYRLGILGGARSKLYLHVVVRQGRGGRSRVVSFWACRTPDPGEEILWFKKEN